MSEDRTDVLIATLARELRPVRPVPRLGIQALGATAIGLAAAALLSALRGLRPDQVGMADGAWLFGALAVGLGVVGAGALAAALASARPGRERIAGIAGIASLGTLLLCAIPALWLLASESALPGPGVSGARELPCLVFGLLLGLPVALVVTRLVARAAPLEPRRTALWVALGASALGTLAAHLTCRTPGGWHVVLVHPLAPLVGALLLARPIRRLLARWARTPV
jgi:hypothetical protein